MRDELSRREWLTGCLAAVGGAIAASEAGLAEAVGGTIETVTGAIPASGLGRTLIHEHVLVDFIGADRVSPSRYQADEVFKVALPHLEQVKKLGCDSLVECTPAYLGRDPELLQRLSKASGVQILTNTGYYGAANDKHVPAHAYQESDAQLAKRWIREAGEGIDGTGIKPAFMKIGVDGAPLSDIDAKLVRAAALTHRETRLPIASHTGSGAAAMEELDIIERAKTPASAFIWVHAHSEKDQAFHVRAGKRGAWLSFDGVHPKSVARHVELVRRMRDEGLLTRVLVSHDAGWYHVGEPNGGSFRAFDTVFTEFVPALQAAGFSEAEVRTILVDNPANAFAIAV